MRLHGSRSAIKIHSPVYLQFGTQRKQYHKPDTRRLELFNIRKRHYPVAAKGSARRKNHRNEARTNQVNTYTDVQTALPTHMRTAKHYRYDFRLCNMSGANKTWNVNRNPATEP